MPSTQQRNGPNSPGAAHAADAAKWMREEMGKNNGVLTQQQAWDGVRERFGTGLAVSGETGCWLSKPVLSEFRKITPDVIWDADGKRWRQQKKRDVKSGPRMLDSKAAT